MKLTNYLRDAFVSAAMADVPSADFGKLTDKAHAIVIDDILAQAPAEIRKLWKSTATRPWVHSAYMGFNERLHGFSFSSLYIPSPSYGVKMTEAGIAAVKTLGDEAKAAAKTHDDLKSKLKAVAASCNTRKQLAEALPEFESYLPADEGAALRSLPVVANVVTDFVKAGWPKGMKKMPKAAAQANTAVVLA
jgi:hypothetical protein